jgi:hypothetical protein
LIRQALLLVSLFVASSAYALWHPVFDPNYVELTAGDNTVVTLRATWTGFSTPEPIYWVCVSSDESVAHVEGGYGGGGDMNGQVRITAIAPGEAWVQIGRGSFGYVHIVVRPKPVSVSIAPSVSSSYAGLPVTLTATTEGSPHTLRWYLGRRGDLSHPLAGSGHELTVTPVKAGVAYYWVSAIGAQGTSSAEIAIDVRPAPRRRAVARR